MPAVVREFVDQTCGHCYTPTIFIEGSPDTFVNALPVVRKGDAILPHCCGNTCHGGSAVGNSSNVYVNGRLLQVVTNSVTCGDHSCAGSPDTFCGA